MSISDTALNSTVKRDYSLTGESARSAVQAGLASAEWYHTKIPRDQMKALMQRRDGPALRDTAIWLAGLLASGLGAVYFWGSWWCLPFFAVYGVLYGSACDSRWHECGHGTAFRTQWMNKVVYHIASFMEMRNPITWRWSHARHHTDTYIVGRDAEIAVMRPPDLVRAGLNVFGIIDASLSLMVLARQSLGILSDDEKDFVLPSDIPNAVWVARAHIGIYLITIGVAAYMHSILPLLLIGLPRLYGCWHMVATGLLQHLGLADNVLDHRLNTRTVLMGPVTRFIIWNMNYHVEHHMFPMVPYHALPKLHALIKYDLPPANPSIWHAYREVWPVLIRQLRYQDVFLKRELPATAKPYRVDLSSELSPAAAE